MSRAPSSFTAICRSWDLWVVHLWVEDFLELFTTIMVAYMFVLLGIVHERVALIMIYPARGPMYCVDHFWGAGLLDFVATAREKAPTPVLRLVSYLVKHPDSSSTLKKANGKRKIMLSPVFVNKIRLGKGLQGKAAHDRAGLAFSTWDACYIFTGVAWVAMHCHFPFGIFIHVSVQRSSESKGLPDASVPLPLKPPVAMAVLPKAVTFTS